MNGDPRTFLTRRHFLGSALHGIGGVALASLAVRDAWGVGADEASGATGPFAGIPAPGALPAPHFAPRAKRIICLWQGGGPSHVDLFDPKPELARRAGEDIPATIRGDTRL